VLFSVLLDHLVRPRQHIRRNRQADLLGCFQIDDQLKLRPLFYWNVAWLSALEKPMMATLNQIMPLRDCRLRMHD
jgi:hypothetical protein